MNWLMYNAEFYLVDFFRLQSLDDPRNFDRADVGRCAVGQLFPNLSDTTLPPSTQVTTERYPSFTITITLPTPSPAPSTTPGPTVVSFIESHLEYCTVPACLSFKCRQISLSSRRQSKNSLPKLTSFKEL